MASALHGSHFCHRFCLRAILDAEEIGQGTTDQLTHQDKLQLYVSRTMSTIRIPCRLAPHRAAALCLQSKLFGSSTSSSSAPPAILNTTTHTTASTTTLTRYPQQRRPRTKQSRNHSSLSRASQTSRFQRFPAPRCASYHSYDHPVPPAAFSSVERTILAAAYAHVPQHGFSQAALALGARDAGYLDISTNLLPDGVFSLIQWHLVSQRESLAGRAQVLFAVGDEGQGAGERLGMGRKVEMLTWERLMGNQLVIRRWQEVRV